MQQVSTTKGSFGRLTPSHSPPSDANHCQPNAIETPRSVPPSFSPTIQVHGEIEIAGRHYVRQRSLAAILGVTSRTLARWIALGIGPPKIKIGKTVLFDLGKLPEWLAAREAAPTRNGRR